MKKELGIIGGGVIGLSIAWQCLRAGWAVTVLERDKVGEGTSAVAAGMLAPEAEVDFGEERVMKLGQRSLSLYPEFLGELREDVPNVPALDTCGTVLVGKDRDDAERLKQLYEFRKELGLDVEWWGGSHARDRFELLSPRVSAAIWLPDDAQIENRSLLDALKRAIEAKGGNLKEESEVKAYGKGNDGKWWVRSEKGDEHFQELLLAAGAWSGFQREGKKGPPLLHPVKGQILTLGPFGGGGLDRMIRSPRVYLVPKTDGTVRVGGTSEELGFDLTPTAGGVRELLEEAWELVPAVQDAPFLSVDVGLRPSHRDHRPAIGRDEAGLLYATGHYRHGFLFAPVTAYAVRDLLEEGAIREPLLKEEEVEQEDQEQGG